MPKIALETRYTFHPVGQGLFATGLFAHAETEKPFHWVYDCGTTSSQELLVKALDSFCAELKRLRPKLASKPKIDLVTVSHFDLDHISGLVSLLAKFSIGTLLLPYVPLWQRLMLAFAEGVDTQQGLMEFFINPVAYVTGQDGVQIDEIVLVPSSGDEGPAEEPSAQGQEPPASPDNIRRILIWEGALPTDDEQKEDEVVFERRGGSSIYFLKSSSRLRIAGLWEFVPYNDSKITPAADSKFLNMVNKRRDDLLAATSDSIRKSTLRDIRDLYDKKFGHSAKKRNLISLFLYAGPIGSHAEQLDFFIETLTSRGHDQSAVRSWHEWRGWTPQVQRIGILYTGDGYLNTDDRLARLIRYIGSNRMNRMACLQVMHHGAKNNWHAGLAQQLKPDISVFCSDPAHKRFRHPHGDVVRDFLPFGPVQVDKRCGITIHAEAIA